MDLLRSKEAASATSLEKPFFRISRSIVSRHNALVTPDLCETSMSEVALTGSMAWEAQEDVHQKRMKVSKLFLLRQKKSNEDHEEVAREENSQKDLS